MARVMKLEIPNHGFEVVCHSNGQAHADEAAAMAIAYLHGTKKWFDTHVRRDRKIYVGDNGGCFDEHTLGDIIPDDVCAAVLVAESLGIENDPCWEKILKTVCSRDRRPIDTCPHSLGKVINLANDFRPKDAIDTTEWGALGFQILYRLEVAISRDGIDVVTEYLNSDGRVRNLGLRTRDLVVKKGYEPKLVMKVMDGIIDGHDLLSIWQVARAMVYFYPVMDAVEWLVEGVELMVQSTWLLEEANDLAVILEKRVNRVFGRKGYSITYAETHSENRLLSGALRHLGVPICLQFNVRGNPIIFYETSANLDMGFVVAELRAARLKKMNSLVPPREILMKEGDSHGFFYYRNATGGQFVAFETRIHPRLDGIKLILDAKECEDAMTIGFRIALDDKQYRLEEKPTDRRADLKVMAS